MRQLTVGEMEPTGSYLSGRQKNYPTKLVKIDKQNKVGLIRVYFKELHEWKELGVDLGYQVVEDTREPGKPGSTPSSNEKRTGPKNRGQVSGLSMMEAWAYHIGKNVRIINGRSLTIEAMVAEFPHNGESILKWIDTYLYYYNVGRLPGTTRLDTKLQWLKPKSSDPVADAMEDE